MAIFTPLALGKRDMPKNSVASGALTGTINAIGTQAPFKSKAAAVEYWEALVAFCSRNIAELNGVGAKAAKSPAGGTPKGRPKTAKTSGVGAYAGAGL